MLPRMRAHRIYRNHRQVNANDVFSEVSKLKKVSDSSGVALVVGSSLTIEGKVFNTALIITPHNKIKKYFKRP